MDYSGYISSAYEYDFRRIELSKTDLRFLVNDLLRLELSAGSFSAYKIYSKLKNQGVSMAYKNVNQKVRKMLTLGLIEEIKGGFIQHGAKYYRVSPKGWVNIIIRGVLDYRALWGQAIRIYYYQNVIFQTFFYPFFEMNTVIGFPGYEINSYLSDCCIATIDAIETWEPDGEEIIGIPREKLIGLTKQKFREMLEDKLYKSTMRKFDLMVTPGFDRKKLVEIVRDVAKMKDGKSEQVQFAFDYSLPRERWSEQTIERPAIRCLNVVEAISSQLEEQVTKFLIDLIVECSTRPKLAETLAKDEKFMNAVQPLEAEFRRSYDNLVNLRNKNK